MGNAIEYIDEFFGVLKDAYDMTFQPGPDRREAFSFASTKHEEGVDVAEAAEAFVEAFGKTLESASLEAVKAAEDLAKNPKAPVEPVVEPKAEKAKGKKKAKAKAKAKTKAKTKAKAKAKSKAKVKSQARSRPKTTAKGPSKAMQAYEAFIQWGGQGHDEAVAKAEADKEAAITAIQEALETNRNNAGTYLSRFRRNDVPAK